MRKKKNDQPESYSYFLWEVPDQHLSLHRLESAVEQVIREQYPLRRARTNVSFYPYTCLKSTIKIERDIIRIRISDILQDAPQDVLAALIHILLRRAVKKPPQKQHIDHYNQYIDSVDIDAKHALARIKRTRKQLVGPIGKYHNLNRSFTYVNKTYFQHGLEKPNLSWSPNPSRHQLGYHDAHLNLVVVSRWLDRKHVPSFLVDYIMYHELLHIVVPPQRVNGKRIVHSKEFKRREQQFKHYEEALRWLNQKGLY